MLLAVVYSCEDLDDAQDALVLVHRLLELANQIFEIFGLICGSTAALQSHVGLF